MDELKERLILLPGGRQGNEGEPAATPRGTLRVIQGGGGISSTIREAVEAARSLRAEIESRIAQAFDPFDGREP